MTLHLHIPGIPRPAGSKRGFPLRRKDGSVGVVITDDSGARGKEWRRDVAAVAREEVKRQGWTLSYDPLRVTMRFMLPRPKAHYRANGDIKETAGWLVTTKPDVLKLARAVEDSLTGIVWQDDAQIAVETLSKWYVGPGEEPGVVVKVTPAPVTDSLQHSHD